MKSYTSFGLDQLRNGTGQDFFDPTGKFQNLQPFDWFLTGPVHRFFTEGLCLLFNASNEIFPKEGA